MQYADFRRDYTLGGLKQEMLDACPVKQFTHWQDQAVRAGLKDPTAASLATVEADGHLWQRIVLLKEILDDCFVFFTNYTSNKAKALDLDPRASLLFPWNEIDRQVTVSGTVSKLTSDHSDQYFASRPRESQIGAWASNQSQPIADRQSLENQYQAALDKFGDGEVPRPAHWGGYMLRPTRVEFWQGGEHRLHDRFRYDLHGTEWALQRLQP